MSDDFNRSELTNYEDITVEKKVDYTGPEVPKKKKKGSVIGLGIAGAVVLAGVVAVLIMGPAKALNSFHMLGSKTSYYKWIEQKNSDGIIDYLYAKDSSDTASNVTLSAAFASNKEDISKTTPVELSAVVYRTADSMFVKLPLISQEYFTAGLSKEQYDSLAGIQYFLPNTDNGIKTYLKKYVKQLVSDAVESAKLTKNQVFELNGVSVTANQVRVVYDIGTIYDDLHDIFEDMKIDEAMYAELEKEGIKKSEYKTILTNLSAWASTQKNQTEYGDVIVMDCYVDDYGKIIGRELEIDAKSGNGTIGYLLQQNQEDTDVTILITQDEQTLSFQLCMNQAEIEEGITEESALTIQEYVQKLSSTNLTVLKALLNQTGMTGIEDLLGIAENKEEETASSGTETVIEVGSYTGISVEAVDTTVTDSEIAQELQDFVNYYSDMIKITDRTDVQDLDFVNLDYTGRIDGEEFEGGSSTGAELQVGSDSFIDGFEEALVGHDVGSTFTFKVTFPDPYTSNEDLSGKEAEFTVKINAIGKRELSDEFIAANTDLSTVEEYRNQVAQDLASQKEYDAKEQIKSDIMTEIIKDCTITSLNQDDVKAEYDSMVSTYESYSQMYGVDLETYAMYMFGLSLDDFYSEMEYYAEFYVKEAAIIKEIAKLEGMSLSEEEYQNELTATVEQYGYESADALEESYGKEQLYQLFLQDKVYAFLLDQAIYVTE